MKHETNRGERGTRESSRIEISRYFCGVHSAVCNDARTIEGGFHFSTESIIVCVRLAMGVDALRNRLWKPKISINMKPVYFTLCRKYWSSMELLKILNVETRLFKFQKVLAKSLDSLGKESSLILISRFRFSRFSYDPADFYQLQFKMQKLP